MATAMQWEHLYSETRSGDKTGKQPNADTLRTSFTRDYDRIIFSSAFRRLQNKTQVFPLPGPAFVHNRLTHSLEVSSVGRSLGKAVGEHLAAEYGGSESFRNFYVHELPFVIAAACLAHDIGNPPFGHSGEDAIRNYFNTLDKNTQHILEDNLSKNQLADFRLFEGNSNAFRILTHNFNELQSPYNITLTTLASIVKYPCSSIEGFDKSKNLISTKKSGFFDSEINTWKTVASQFHIPRIASYENVYARHPFVYLTEAADDICYRIIDLEDAHRLGMISLEKITALFLPFFDDDTVYFTEEKVIRKLENIRDPNQKVQYLRAVWISRMTELLKDVFVKNEQQILAGSFQHSLMDALPPQYATGIKAINDFSFEHIYNHKTVVEIEIAGFNVIGSLLDTFIQAVLNPNSNKSEKLLQLVSKQFPINPNEQFLYSNIQSVTDYIAGMTDLYALDLYRKITGITIKEL